jgi:hypothetical protein
MYATTDVMPRPKTSVVGTKKQLAEWTSSIPDLDQVYQMKSYEQLENIVNAWLNGDTETAESDDTSVGYTKTTTPPSTPKQTSKTTKTKKDTTKTFDDIDDAFADLEGDDFDF